MLSIRPYSIYIHLPFCKSRCAYCDFVTYQSSVIPFNVYGEKVIQEYMGKKTVVGDCAPVSVYVGGGTPSLWPAQILERLLEALGIGENKNVEVTVEVNPGDADAQWFERLVAAGVNRVSIGIQSMDDGRLEWLGRRHNVAEAIHAVARAQSVGVRNVSVDFIYATPDMSLEQLGDEIEKLCALDVQHVSAYELTIGPDTPLGRMRHLNLPDDDVRIAMWYELEKTLRGSGYNRYEVSNYGKPGFESRHNQHYWQGGIYVGLGAGAHGHLVIDGKRYRYCNPLNVDDYLKMELSLGENPLGSTKTDDVVTHGDYGRELIMLGLRTTRGVDLSVLKSLVDGQTWSGWREIFLRLVNQEYGVITDERFLPNQSGLLMADELASRFF